MLVKIKPTEHNRKYKENAYTVSKDTEDGLEAVVICNRKEYKSFDGIYSVALVRIANTNVTVTAVIEDQGHFYEV